MRLAELQRAFFARIAQVGEPSPELEAEVRPQGALSPAERLDLYANMYLLRLLEVLRQDFSAVAKLLGEEAFEAEVAAYVRARPSTHPSLGALGRGFEAHLRGRALSPPEAADLAALEWARAEVRVEADAAPAPTGALAGLGPERFGEARLVLVPALRVLTPEYDVCGLWRDLELGQPGPSTGSGRAGGGAGNAGPSTGSGRAGVVVWRRGFEVFHAAVPMEEARALRLTQEGKALAEICAAFETAEEPARAAFAALASWLAEEMVARVEG